MEYSKILKQAFTATKRHRIMWLLGIFVAGSSTGCRSTNFNISGQTSNIISSLGNSAADFNISERNTEQWLTAYWWIIALVVLLLLVLFIVKVILHNVAVGGMFYGAKQAAADQPVLFSDMFKIGTENFFRVFGFHILVKVAIFAVVLIISIPLILLAITIVGLVIVIPVIIFLLIASIPIAIAIHILIMYTRQFIVLKQQAIFTSLKSAWKLLRNNLGNSIVIYFLGLLLGIGVGIISIIILLLIVIPFVIIGFLVYNAASWSGVVLVSIIGVPLLLIALLIIKGIYNAFGFHLWHGAWAELLHNQSEQSIVTPEIIKQ